MVPADSRLTGLLDKNDVMVREAAQEACKDAEAIVICTEWDEFRKLDWEKSKQGWCISFRWGY
jgi:UDP-glucose 6-dehydrogenase